MVMSKTDAEAALAAVRNSLKGGKSGFEALSASHGYLFSKHQSKKTALVAAREDAQTKGYFKSLKESSIESLAQYKKLEDGKHAKISGLPKKPQAKNFGKGKSVILTDTYELGQIGFTNLIHEVISSDGEFRLAPTHPDSRFLYVTDIPDGYVGRSITPGGAKTKSGIDLAILIFSATPGSNPVLFNFFPSDVSYLHDKPPLV